MRLICPSRRKSAQPPLKSRRQPVIQEQFPCETGENGRCVATLAPQWVSGDLALEVHEVAFRQVTLMHWQGSVGTGWCNLRGPSHPVSLAPLVDILFEQRIERIPTAIHRDSNPRRHFIKGENTEQFSPQAQTSTNHAFSCFPES